MSIRLAVAPDIDRVVEITRACNLFMRSQGIFQWTDKYPSKNSFLNDLKREELYVLEEKNQIIGCIVISTFMDEVYRPVKWLTKNTSHIYIHRIAIHPENQGKGNAQKLMNYAEDYAREKAFVSVRLDTFSQNPRNMRFYETRGYERLETIQFPEQSEFPFYCYEKVL